MKVYYADTDTLTDKDIYLSWLSRMPEERREKIEKFRFEKDRRLSLGAGILLYQALKEEGIDYSAVKIGRGKNEKPFLTDFPEIHFNLSHSDSRVMCVTGDTSVGCDVQKKKESDLRIAKRFFAPEEVLFIESAADRVEQANRFCRIWTLKESYIKALGSGLSTGLESFCVSFDKNTGEALNIGEYFFREFDLEEEYCYSLCKFAPKGQNGLYETPKIDKIIFRPFGI